MWILNAKRDNKHACTGAHERVRAEDIRGLQVSMEDEAAVQVLQAS